MSEYASDSQGSTAEKMRALDFQRQYLLLADQFKGQTSLTLKFKNASDIANVSAYIAAPILVGWGMTMSGHAGPALVLPLVGLAGGIIGGTVFPVASAVLGGAQVMQTDSQAHIGQLKPGDSEAVTRLKDGFRHSQINTLSQQTYSVIASVIAAFAMSLSLASAIKHEGINPAGIPVSLVASIAGLYFGRKANKEAEQMAVFKAAINNAQPSIN